MKHVVFLDGTPTGLLAMETAKRLGCYVTLARPKDSSFISFALRDEAKFRPYLRFVDNYIEVENLSEGLLRPVLERVHSDRAIDAIVTVSEVAIVAAAREARHFGTLYASPESLARAIQKHECRRVLREAGLRAPEFEVLSEKQLLDNGPRTVKFPLVVKPTRGFAKHFSAICRNVQELDEFRTTLRAARANSDQMIAQIISHEYLIEEYIKGMLYSVEVLVQGGKISCLATTKRYRADHSELLEMTTTIPSDLPPTVKDQMVSYVGDVIRAAGLEVGIYHVEVMLDDRGPCLIEINARMIGGIAPRLYQKLTNIDPFEVLIRLHLGEEISVSDSRISGGGTTVVVGAPWGGKVADTFNSQRLDALLKEYKIEISSLQIEPGTEYQNFEGNLSLIGYVVITCETSMQAARKGTQFLAQLQDLTGIRLATYTVA